MAFLHLKLCEFANHPRTGRPHLMGTSCNIIQKEQLTNSLGINVQIIPQTIRIGG